MGGLSQGDLGGSGVLAEDQGGARGTDQAGSGGSGILALDQGNSCKSGILTEGHGGAG